VPQFLFFFALRTENKLLSHPRSFKIIEDGTIR